MVARDAAERERESLWCACAMRERERERELVVCGVRCAERGIQGGILISLLFNENLKFSQISILKYFIKMITF